jgi:hypothetical protein
MTVRQQQKLLSILWLGPQPERRFKGIPKDRFYWFRKECHWWFNGGGHTALLQQLKAWYRAAINRS